MDEKKDTASKQAKQQNHSEYEHLRAQSLTNDPNEEPVKLSGYIPPEKAGSARVQREQDIARESVLQETDREERLPDGREEEISDNE